jgi:hypothetical protein
MTGARAVTEKVRRLADDLHAKVIAEEALIARADKITIEAFPKGDGYDLRVTISTR